MTESPVSTLEQKKDRRGLLALIGAGGAAAVAALFSRSNGAEAHGTLHLDSSGAGVPTIHGNHTSTGPGVEGTSTSGPGAFGQSTSGYGVWGFSGSGNGVGGYTTGSGYGVYGASSSGYGVYGYSGSGDGLRARRASSGDTGAGVQGFSGVIETDAPDRVGGRFVGADTGVRGEGSTTGVTGKGTGAGAVGLYGNAGGGAVGVRAEASGTKTALHVKGRSRFKQSGKTTVSAGAYSKVVPLTFTLAAGSLVVATLQGNAGSGVAVRTASKYGTAKIRITLTKAATKSATIAYLIFTP